ncbi:hypothetical protein [Actinokineospora pegani]|uniref:hypothetical protein n=1 Tax=Actinokineospora pegani TaxID=2654637 RepID=UPI0012EA559C|nr:hypothetical protein [Actinokineospora pegani]
MYIDEGLGAPLGKIGKAMDDFAGSAAAGQFAVNQSGGDALLAAIAELVEWIDSNVTALGVIEQRPRLGSSNAALVMAPYDQAVATDHQGFLTQLQALRQSLAKAEEGIRTAMANYRDVDQSNASTLA